MKPGRSQKFRNNSSIVARAAAARDVGTIGRFHEYRGLILLILAALVLWMNVTFLVPLVMGSIFAIVLYPLMGRMASWRVGRPWRAAIITTLFAISFLLPIGMIVFLGAENALAEIERLREAGISTSTLSAKTLIQHFNLQPIIDKLQEYAPASESQIRQAAVRIFMSLGDWTVKALQGFLATLPGAVFNTFIILLTIFFLLVDGERTRRFIRENSIFGPRQTDHIFAAVGSLCYSVVVASIAAGAVQALLIFISCLVTRTPGAVLIALASFVLSFLPMLGTLPVTAGLCIVALLQGDFTNAVIFLVFAIVVGISDNIVRPYVLKGGAELHPLVGFVAAFGALDALGFYGVFIGPVVAGLFFTMLPMVTRTYGRRATAR